MLSVTLLTFFLFHKFMTNLCKLWNVWVKLFNFLDLSLNLLIVLIVQRTYSISVICQRLWSFGSICQRRWVPWCYPMSIVATSAQPRESQKRSQVKRLRDFGDEALTARPTRGSQCKSQKHAQASRLSDFLQWDVLSATRLRTPRGLQEPHMKLPKHAQAWPLSDFATCTIGQWILSIC